MPSDLLFLPVVRAEDVTTVLGPLASQVQVWVATAYEAVPALVIALACSLILPAIAVFGYILPKRRADRGSDRTTARVSPRSHRHGRAGANGDGTPDALPMAPEPGTFALLQEGRLVGAPAWDALRIGAGADCNIRLDDSSVEDLHAVVLRDPVRGVEIVRLASDRGSAIYVDGEAVVRRPLRGGETIRIGHNVFSFQPHYGWESP